MLLDIELLRAADRGVLVRLILNDKTAHSRDVMLSTLSLHPNISIRIFNPTRSRQSSLRRGAKMALIVLSINRRIHMDCRWLYSDCRWMKHRR